VTPASQVPRVLKVPAVAPYFHLPPDAVLETQQQRSPGLAK
jgi:hypothetical protein